MGSEARQRRSFVLPRARPETGITLPAGPRPSPQWGETAKMMQACDRRPKEPMHGPWTPQPALSTASCCTVCSQRHSAHSIRPSSPANSAHVNVNYLSSSHSTSRPLPNSSIGRQALSPGCISALTPRFPALFAHVDVGRGLRPSLHFASPLFPVSAKQHPITLSSTAIVSLLSLRHLPSSVFCNPQQSRLLRLHFQPI